MAQNYNFLLHHFGGCFARLLESVLRFVRQFERLKVPLFVTWKRALLSGRSFAATERDDVWNRSQLMVDYNCKLQSLDCGAARQKTERGGKGNIRPMLILPPNFSNMSMPMVIFKCWQHQQLVEILSRCPTFCWWFWRKGVLIMLVWKKMCNYSYDFHILICTRAPQQT